ncbi:MAG: excinuclease ABC subunit UvrB [Erysipelotrichales bacterium]|nr:excinuclease ABC subunit UvrB [Erysipelotrichales bacterium]
MDFKLVSEFKLAGDQIEAVKTLTDNLKNNVKEQILLGATGTGKTFTISNVIKNYGKRTLILAHNKTLAGQLYTELKEYFPENRVEYFISYYDYYQPEAYVPSSDTYIEKDASINDEIDEMRHSATTSLLEREDVIIVASVSCIYGIGDKDDYRNSMLFLRTGMEYGRKNLLRKLVEMLYERNDIDFKRGSFRVRGDVIEVIPVNNKANGIRIELFGDEIERMREVDVLTGVVKNEITMLTLYPASHFVTNKEKLMESTKRIEEELKEQIELFTREGKLLEAQRIKMRTEYDLEMLRETGVCGGVENYSRHLTLKAAGETPTTLVDFFERNFLLVVDESHVTIPQVGGMYAGDRSRKTTLVEHGFRLPSALDNRPLRFEEFEERIDKAIYLSATPGPYELNRQLPIVEQIIRPTGLLDPIIEVRPTFGQIDDIVKELEKRIALNERILITTLTIRMSEDLTSYLKSLNYKVAYLHSEIKSLERIEILRDLRIGKYQCLVGINLLREGLDLPEVSMVCILDADKQGFLRSERSLIQTIGRAARNKNGLVVMYADKISSAMDYAIKETERRRKIQEAFNEKHGITPQTIIKQVHDAIRVKEDVETKEKTSKMSDKETKKLIERVESEMRQSAKMLDFERAAELRDLLIELRGGKK